MDIDMDMKDTNLGTYTDTYKDMNNFNSHCTEN